MVAFKLWAGQEILPGPAPTAVAKAEPTEVAPGAEVSFEDFISADNRTKDKDIKVTWQETESGYKYNFRRTEIDGVVTNWSWDFGDGNSGSGATTTHTYTQPGNYTATLSITADHDETASTTVTVTVVTPSLRLTADPTSIPVSTEEAQSTSTLTVRIEDSNGNLVTGVSYTVNLTLSDDNLGTLEPTTLTVEGEEEATFTASTRSGCEFITASGEGLNEAYTNINVHGPLSSVEVTPASATLNIGQSKQFNATGKDANGITIPNLTFSWSMQPGAGTLSSNGFFTATALSGWKTITAAETQTGISGTAQVRVVPPLHHITVSPNPVTLKVDDTQSFTATGYDAQNNVVPITPTWSVTGNIGTIDNAGNFTATTLGTGSVKATASGITGSASVTVDEDGDGDQAPTITITRLDPPTSPDNDKTFITTDNITLEAKVMSGTTDVTSQASISWSGGGTPSTGSGSTFSTKYSTADNHTVTARAIYQDAQASATFTLEQDEIDFCRQEYVDHKYTRPIPGRSRFTQTKHSQHYSFSDLNTSDHRWAIIEQGLLNGLEATGTNYPNHWENLSSAYRNPNHNDYVGGEPTSWHLEGRAADIDGDSKAENLAIYKAMEGTGFIERIAEPNLKNPTRIHGAW